jgi:CheY-like chemotaxis protein
MHEKKEILIIDDEVDFRLELAEILVEMGYIVSTASNGAEALHYIQREGRIPDLITLDFKMPELDGVEFINQLAELKTEIPFIMISGYLPDKYALEGPRAYLPKPLDKHQILTVLENPFIWTS